MSIVRIGVLVGIVGALLTSLIVLGGCMTAAPYRLSYDGQDACFTPVAQRYAAGSQVTVYYTLIATDTDYSFYLDGEPLNYTFSDKGIMITFEMPGHDAVLTCKSRNSMVYQQAVE